MHRVAGVPSIQVLGVLIKVQLDLLCPFFNRPVLLRIFKGKQLKTPAYGFWLNIKSGWTGTVRMIRSLRWRAWALFFSSLPAALINAHSAARASVAHVFVRHNTSLYRNGLAQDEVQDEDALDDELAARSHGKCALDAKKDLGRRAEVEAAGIAEWVDRGEGGVLVDGGLAVGEAVRVQGAAHLWRVADDVALVPRSQVAVIILSCRSLNPGSPCAPALRPPTMPRARYEKS